MRRLAAASALAVLALSGCTSEVATTFTVTSTTQADVTTGVLFTGEAASVLAANPKLLGQLEAVFTDRTGSKPHVRADRDRVEVSAQVPYARLKALADVTGVRGATLSPAAHEQTTIGLSVAGAPKLVDAIRTAAQTQPEPAAVAETMLANTTLVTRVVFPGGVQTPSKSAAGLVPSADGGAVTYSRPVTSTTPDTYSVTGDPTGTPWLYWAGAGALMVALAGGVLWRRSR